jgi:hypothetical protein
MAAWDRDDRVARVNWLYEFDISDRQEKRARALKLPWPPWVQMGSRIFYSRQGTAEWFAAEAAKSLVGGDTGAR